MPSVDRLRQLRSLRQATLTRAQARYQASLNLWRDDLPEEQQDSEITAATRAYDEAQAALDLVEAALANLRLLRVCVWAPPASATAAEGARV